MGDPRHDHQVVQSTLCAAVREGDCEVLVCGEACCVRSPGDLGMISMHGVWGFPLLVYRAARAIRTGQLRALPRFHTRPIDVLVLHGPRGDLVLR